MHVLFLNFVAMYMNQLLLQTIGIDLIPIEGQPPTWRESIAISHSFFFNIYIFYRRSTPTHIVTFYLNQTKYTEYILHLQRRMASRKNSYTKAKLASAHGSKL